ncbi:MAG: ABC transporter ATP-binding protein [Actinobacteria bacterium]|nr:ABC transporter ATP-binding protein [Actinomycetota bacterium]
MGARRVAYPLQASRITKRFGGLTALQDVSLVVPPRGIVGLIGPNGAGKTTFFNCVTGVYPPTVGRVQLFGQDVTGWPADRRAHLGVARTYQRLELFRTLTVRENVLAAFEARYGSGDVVSDLFALPATIETRYEADAQVDVVLEMTGLQDRADVAAGELPLGTARVVEFARAIVTKPRLLMLDEPSSGLRAEESQHLADLVRRVRDGGTSVLLVEHDMSFVLELSDYVYVLDFGELLAEGTPALIRQNEGVRAAYLGTEAAS